MAQIRKSLALPECLPGSDLRARVSFPFCDRWKAFGNGGRTFSFLRPDRIAICELRFAQINVLVHRFADKRFSDVVLW